MPTKKKTELPEEMTTSLEAQEPQTEGDTTALPAEGAPDDTLSLIHISEPTRP